MCGLLMHVCSYQKIHAFLYTLSYSASCGVCQHTSTCVYTNIWVYMHVNICVYMHMNTHLLFCIFEKLVWSSAKRWIWKRGKFIPVAVEVSHEVSASHIDTCLCVCVYMYLYVNTCVYKVSASHVDTCLCVCVCLCVKYLHHLSIHASACACVCV